MTNHQLATGGEDGQVCIWDLRKPESAVFTLRAEHGHWVCAVKYNSLHEELLLSGGTDSKAVLWRLPKGADIFSHLEVCPGRSDVAE